MKTTIILAVLTIFAIASAKPCIPRPPIHFDPYNVQHLNIGNGGDGGRGGWGGILGGDGGDGGDGGNFFYRMLKHRNYYEQPKLKYYSRFNFQPSLTSLQLGNGGDGGRGGFGKYYGGNGGNFNAILGGFKPFRLFTKRIMPNPCESGNTFFDVNIGNAAAGGTGGMGGVLGGMGGAGGNAADINGFIKTILQTPRSFKPNDRQKYYVGGRPLYDENGNFQYNIRNRFEPIYMTQEIPAILGEAGATSVDSVAAGASAVNTGVDATTTGVGLAGEGVGKGFHLISSVTNGFFNKPIYPYSKQDFVPIKYSDYSF